MDCVNSPCMNVCCRPASPQGAPIPFSSFLLRAYLAASFFFPLVLAPVIAAVIMRAFANHRGEENLSDFSGYCRDFRGFSFFSVCENLVKCAAISDTEEI